MLSYLSAETPTYPSVTTLQAVFAFVVGIVVGTSLTLLLAIVVSPSRRVRNEPPLELEVQLRLLLGLDPDAPLPALPLDRIDTSWQFDTAQMQSLRDLDVGPDEEPPDGLIP